MNITIFMFHFINVALGACCSAEATNGCVEDVTKDQCLTIDSEAVWTLAGDCTQQQCRKCFVFN